MREQMHAAETHGVRMPADEYECNRACPALGGVHEIAGPGVIAYVGLPPEPYIEAVQRMIKKRQIDEEDLEKKDKRQTAQELHLIGIGVRAIGGEGIGDEVL